MAKRVADTQMTKDTMSDNNGGTWGASMGQQKATVETLDKRKRFDLKHRSSRGRRSMLRPPGISSPQQQQSMPSFIQPNDASHQQQGGFAFGQQGNGTQSQISASFPPFQQSSNSDFNTSFSVPSPSFSFNAAPVENNPFAAVTNNISKPLPATRGFHGTIFNVDTPLSKAEKKMKDNEVPQFAPGAPDFPSQFSESGQGQMQSKNNPFEFPTPQQQSSQDNLNIFSQAPTQQQQPSFPGQNQDNKRKSDGTTDIFSGLYPSQNQSLTKVSNTTASDIFAGIPASQSKPFVNPFAASIASFQKSPQNQSTSNIFGGVAHQPSQPSTGVFGQVSTSATQPQAQSFFPSTSGGDSIMQTSPDNSPEARGKTQGGLISLLNQNNSGSELQSSPTKQSDASVSRGSLFDRISAPSADKEDRSPFSAPPGATNLTQGGSLFDRVSVNTSDTNAQNSSSSPKDNKTQDHATSVDKSSWPANNAVAPTTNTQASSTVSEAGNSKQRKIAAPTFFSAVAEDKQSKENPFANLKFPPVLPSKTSSSSSSDFSQKQQANFAQSAQSVNQFGAKNNGGNKGVDKSDFAQLSPSKSQMTSNQDRRFGLAPVAPLNFTDEEKAQLITGYRLKALDIGVQRYLQSDLTDSDMKLLKHFYEEKKQAILAAGGQPLDEAAGSKRKRTINGSHNHDDSSQSNKKAQSLEASDLSSKYPLNGLMQSHTKPSSSLQQITSTSTKRKGDEDLVKDSVSDVGGNSKRSRGENHKSSPLLPPSDSSSSQTSSIFKNILHAEKGNNVSDRPTSTPKDMFNGKQLGQPTFAFSSTFQPKPVAFSSMLSPVTNGDTPTQVPVQPKQAPAASMNTAGPLGHLSAKPGFHLSETDDSSSAPVPPVQPSSSTERASNPFAIKPSIAAPSVTTKVPTLDLPKFGTGASVNFMSQFSEKARENEEEEKKKRKAEDFDSDEEDEAAWERRDAEAQRVKKQKIQEAAKTGAKFVLLQDGKQHEQAQKNVQEKAPPASSDSNISILDKSHPSHGIVNPHNIFGPFSDIDSGAEGSKAGDADDEEDEDEAEQNGQQNKHSRDSSSASLSKIVQPPGRSLFDRISKDEKSIQENPKPISKPVTDDFSQSVGKVPSQSPFAGFRQVKEHTPNVGTDTESIPQGDHTWKADSPIKFGTSNPPAVNVTSPSPSKAPFSGLFGSSKANVSSETPIKSTPSIFSATPTSTPNPSVGFEIKPLVPAKHSLVPPGLASVNTSRATSPGATTGESANESTVDAADGDASNAEGGDHFDLTSAGLLENEVCLFDVMPSKAWLRNATTQEDELQGRGRLRVIKGEAPDGLARILLLSDPSGNEILNTNLITNATYPITGGMLRILAQTKNGEIQNWGVKIAKGQSLSSLKEILDANKKYGI